MQNKVDGMQAWYFVALDSALHQMAEVLPDPRGAQLLQQYGIELGGSGNHADVFIIALVATACPGNASQLDLLTLAIQRQRRSGWGVVWRRGWFGSRGRGDQLLRLPL